MMDQNSLSERRQSAASVAVAQDDRYREELQALNWLVMDLLEAEFRKGL